MQLQLDFSSAKFALLNAKEISEPLDQKEILIASCTDTAPKTECCADPFNAPCNESSEFSINYHEVNDKLPDVSDIWQYTSGASCSSAYPEYDYNFGAGLKEKCKLLDVECGACAVIRVKN